MADAVRALLSDLGQSFAAVLAGLGDIGTLDCIAETRGEADDDFIAFIVVGRPARSGGGRGGGECADGQKESEAQDFGHC